MKPHSMPLPRNYGYIGKSVVNRITGERAFETFNYVDGVSGAICVRMGQYKVYFHNGVIVGVSVGTVMYFHNPDRRNPSTHKRVQEALHNRAGIKTTMGVGTEELREKAGDAVMMLANKIIDARLKGEP